MKTVNQKSLILTCISVILITSVSPAIAYPPDNAAVLYYKAFLILKEPSEDVKKMMADLRDGKIKPNDEIRQYLQDNRYVIEFVETAAGVRDCDWGYDISKGFDVMLPELSKIRMTAFLLTAKAQILSEEGDYKAALGKCLTIHRMARHVGDRLLISNLVGIALNALANKHIGEILSQVPDDIETLTSLKNQIYDITSRANSLKAAMSSEREIALQQIRKENIGTILDSLGDVPDGMSKESIEKVRNGDEEFFRASREYYSNLVTSVLVALDLPYPESHKQLKQLSEKAEKQAADNPAAILSAALWPAVTRICTLDVRARTHFNALKAAIDIYIVRAKTGRLPDTLPAGLPRDLFSGKDFEYEKTKDGFVLSFQSKDLDKDEISKYEFKVSK
ncbi:MAG TPA: hypothetical protein VMX36_03940 [Sedimentisphaerales bacterium]|nr:hypothetical protein [Sedimentisphaerales bacterium]